jgi:hypothetical protein
VLMVFLIELGVIHFEFCYISDIKAIWNVLFAFYVFIHTMYFIAIIVFVLSQVAAPCKFISCYSCLQLYHRFCGFCYFS